MDLAEVEAGKGQLGLKFLKQTFDDRVIQSMQDTQIKEREIARTAAAAEHLFTQSDVARQNMEYVAKRFREDIRQADEGLKAEYAKA